ncbi:putative Sphingoid long-chain base transporter RSB1 [Seiridium unicorne]|uniref:Sphingoid long-chain base transporter RSB1 n=1 Tax=Seiridium unicorne TaxID=138068 RepID=A0ABR2UYM7_9PEZI
MSQTLPNGLISFGPKANCTLDLCPVEWSVFQYRPSLAANGAFIGLFFVVGVLHAVLGFRWKTWFFGWSMILGSIMEIVGYVGRILLHENPFSFVAFMMQIICVTCAPVFYCAGIYVTIAQTVMTLNPKLSRFNPKLYYWGFIICDLISLVLQATGGALSTKSSGDDSFANDIALAGLSFQVFTLVLCCSLLADYLTRYFYSTRFGSVNNRLKIFLCFLGLSILLILARCAYRVMELSEGYSGDLIHDETLFIALEGVLVVCAVFALCIGHPGLGLKEPVEKNVVKMVSLDDQSNITRNVV